MKHDGIIFDFNGTLLDDVWLCINAINVLLCRYGKKTIASPAEYRRVFGFPVVDYYARVGLEAENFDKYAPEWVAEYDRGEPETKLFDGAAELLDLCRKRGYAVYLLSATERDMLMRQLNRLAIADKFDEIIGQESIKAHGKLASALEWSKKVNCKRMLFVGDSTHDAEVARAVGADCVLLACGHAPREALAQTGYPVLDDLCALLAQFQAGEIE